MGKIFFKKSLDSRKIYADHIITSGPTLDNKVQLTATCNVIDVKSVNPELGFKGDDWSNETEIVGELIFPIMEIETVIMGLFTRVKIEERNQIMNNVINQLKLMDKKS